MLDKSRSRIAVILGVSGVFACLVSFFLLSSIPPFEFNFPLGKDKILDKADKFLSSTGITSQPSLKKAVISSNREGIIYLQKVLGIEKANKLLESLPLYYWQVYYYFYPQNKKVVLPLKNPKYFVRIIISPTDGKIIGFSHPIPQEEYKHLAILSKKKSEKIAKNFFKFIKFNISDFKMARYSSIEGKYTFEWERVVPELRIAKLKVKLEIFGDKVGDFVYFLEIPVTELKKIKTGNLSASLLFMVLNLSVLALGIFTLIISIIRRKELEWRFGLVFSLLILLASFMNFLKIGDYKGSYITIFLIFTSLTCITSFVWTLIVSSTAKLFAKESNINLFPIKISSSILLSYIFVFSGLGFTLLVFAFVQLIFKPLNTLGFYSFFSELPLSRISYLIAPLLSLSAGVSEEIFFRALMISFINKFLKKTIWAIVLSSLVWSFIHVTPFGYSDVYPDFIKGIILLPIGFLLGYIFIKFGLVCAIATHYLHDLVVIGAAFLEFSNYRNANENLIVMLIAAILPLVVSLYLNMKKPNA